MAHSAGYVNAEPLRLPFQGSEVIAVECSRAGAESATERASRQALLLLTEYRKGPKSDHEMHEATGLPVTTVCARRNELVRLRLVYAVGKVIGPYGVRNSRWGLTGQ